MKKLIMSIVIGLLMTSTPAFAAGAIAVSRSGEGIHVGIAWNSKTSYEAQNGAIAACTTRGGYYCNVKGNFSNTCAAIGFSADVGWATGYGSTKNAASNSVSSRCPSCEVLAACDGTSSSSGRSGNSNGSNR